MGRDSETEPKGRDIAEFAKERMNRTPEEKRRIKEEEIKERLEAERKERIAKYKDAGLGDLVVALSSQVAKKEEWENFSHSGRVIFGKTYKLPYSDEEIEYLRDRINQYKID